MSGWQQKNSLILLVTPILAAILLLTGCATTSLQVERDPSKTEQLVDASLDNGPANASEASKDPYENFNRAMYTFNESVDTYVAKPIIDGYKWITPTVLQTGVSNVFANMQEINTFLNAMLQGKFQQSAKDSGRFLINTTAGIGGLFDVASYAGLERHEEDFGQTLAVWGVPAGPYLVLPILGPSTFRGVPGSALDTLANPVTYLGWPVAVLAAVDKRATADGALQFIDEAALDPYVFTRESYLQWRDYLAKDGKQDEGDDDLFYDDELDMDDPEEAAPNQHLTVADNNSGQGGISVGVKQQPARAVSPEREKTNVQTLKPLVEAKDAAAVHPLLEETEAMKAYEKASQNFKKAQQQYEQADIELEMLRTRGSNYRRKAAQQ